MRSPGEYDNGHIPGAHNVPLLSNDARALVGTMYKHQGKQKAVELGLSLVTPALDALVQSVKDLISVKDISVVKVIVYCARGGMRSRSVAQLLQERGLPVVLLSGGYKDFKLFLRQESTKKKNIVIIGGKTGVGKTHILHELKKLGEQVFDLEGLACHRGSVFGNLGLDKQPSQQQFALSCYIQWLQFDSENIIYIEDESKRIGDRFVPDELFEQMKHAPRCILELADDLRVSNLMKDYGSFSSRDLCGCVQQLRKRIGGACEQQLIKLLELNKREDFVRILVAYYDKKYTQDLSVKSSHVYTYALESGAFATQAQALRLYCQDTCNSVLGT